MGRRKQIERDAEEAGNYKLRQEADHFKVEKKRGVSCTRIKKDRLFEATRANNAEFKDCALAGKLLRDTLAPLLKDIKTASVTRRVTQLMTQIKNLDPAPAGYRSLATAINTTAAKTLLNGFDFNEQALIKTILPGLLIDNKKKDTFTIKGLSSLKPPLGTAQVIIKSAVACIDLVEKQGQLFEGKAVAVKLPAIADAYVFELPAANNCKGIHLYLLQIRFLSKLKVHVNSGRDNVLGVFDIE